MKEGNMQQRILAIHRFKKGESLESICTSLTKLKGRPYRWIKNGTHCDESWSENRSRRLHIDSTYILTEFSEIVKCSAGFVIETSVHFVVEQPSPLESLSCKHFYNTMSVLFF